MMRRKMRRMMRSQSMRSFLSIFLFAGLFLVAGCGSSPVSTPPQTITGTGMNVQPIAVNLGAERKLS